MVVSVIDGEKKFTTLWEESSDFTVVPSRKNGFTICLEE